MPSYVELGLFELLRIKYRHFFQSKGSSHVLLCDIYVYTILVPIFPEKKLFLAPLACVSHL